MRGENIGGRPRIRTADPLGVNDKIKFIGVELPEFFADVCRACSGLFPPYRCRALPWTRSVHLGLTFEAQAKRRLADEYDAAQERGEITDSKGGGERSGRERSAAKATAADVGLTRKQIHEARAVRDASFQILNLASSVS
jgi:hypothetical protein